MTMTFITVVPSLQSMDGRTTQNLWAPALQWVEHSWQQSVMDSSLFRQ